MKDERKKRTVQKILCVALAAAMLGAYTGTALPMYTGTGITAEAASVYNDFEYINNYNGTVSITGYKGTSSNLIIPSEIYGNRVTEINDYAFYGCTSLKSVTIPNTVTEIDEYVFYGCTGLTSVTIGNSVMEIGEYAFYGCTGLTSVTIPAGVTEIDGGAFSACTRLTDIEVDAGNRNYSSQNGVLFNKNETELVVCPAGKTGSYTASFGVTEIDDYAFHGCAGLTSVTLPSTVREIDDNAFSDCTGLKTIIIPNSVTKISSDAFYNCHSLTIHGERGSYAERYARSNNIPFNNDIFPSDFDISKHKVTVIGSFNEWSTDSATMTDEDGDGVYIGMVKNVGAGVYDFKVRLDGAWDYLWGDYEAEYDRTFNSTINCSVKVDTESTVFVAIDTNGSDPSVWPVTYAVVSDNADTSSTKYGVAGTMTDWKVGSDIPMFEVAEGHYVAEIDYLPADAEFRVRSFNDGTWADSWGVYEPDYDRTYNSQTNVAPGAEAKDFVVYFDTSCNYDMYLWPISYSYIDADGVKQFVYAGSENKSEIPETPTPEKDFNFYFNEYGTVTITKYKGTSSDVVIPSEIQGRKVTEIEDRTFFNLTGLTSVTIPGSVTEIDEGAFSGCTGLMNINVAAENRNYSSQDGALFNKNKTELIVYPAGKIGSYTVPNSVIEIDEYSFSGCTGLTNITIPNSVREIDQGAFSGCTGLTDVTIPGSVWEIDERAFSGCTELKSVIISDGVMEISDYAFSGCTEMTSITIPISVREISFNSFYNCPNLTIYGQNASYAEQYAKYNGIPFADVNNPVVLAEKVILSKTSITLEKGKTQTITATVLPSNTTDKSVEWTTNDSSVATVVNGKITAKGAGTAIITAKTANGMVATCKVTVKNPTVDPTSIKLSKTSITLEKGKTQTITATVSPSNATNKTVTWTTSNSSVATVSNGKITAKGAGTATITAKTANGKTATCKVTVKNPTVDPTSIKLSKTSITLEKGKTQTITATVSPSNATNKTVTWTTSNSSVATVSNGKITAKGAGTATITAKTANGKTATCKVTVKNPTVNVTGIKLNTTRTWLGRGETYQLSATVSPSNATNKKVTWTSSNNSIATVSNGKVTAKKDGTVTITAKTSNGKTATCKITVQPPASKITLNKSTLYLGVGEKFQLTSSVQSGTASAKRGFSSSNNNICYTSGSGQLTAKKTGTAYITVKTFNGKTAQCKVVVQPPAKAVHISKSWLTLHVGQKFQLSSWVDAGTASTKRAWSSSDNNTVYTSGNGLLTAKKTGTANITVKTFNGVSSTLKVKVIK